MEQRGPVSEPADHRHNLPNNLSIPASKFLPFVNSSSIAVNDQAVVLLAAASALVGSIALQDDVQRLLPQWFRGTVIRFFLLSVHDRNNCSR
jgi:hypothetical protein